MSETSGRRLPLVGYLTATSISNAGTRISMIAIPWLVLTTTGSATRTGLVAFAEMLPMVLVMTLGGPLIDRIGPRRVSIFCDLVSMVAVGVIPVLFVAGMLPLPVLMGLVAIAGAMRGPGDAAKHALTPSLADIAGVRYERVTGLTSATERAAQMAGAGLAGGLVALLGPAPTLYIDAGSFGVCAVLLAATLRTRDLRRVGGQIIEPDTPQGYLDRLREGFRFLVRDPVLLGIAVMVAVTNLLDQAWSVVLLPVWARDSGYGALAIGLWGLVFGGASAAGSALAAAFGERLPRFRTYLFAFLIAGAPRFVSLALGVPLVGVLGVALVSGFAAGFINPLLGAVQFERIPRPMVGRVSSVALAGAWSLNPFGGLVGGLLVTALGGPPALLVVGGVYLAATLAPAVSRRFRDMDRGPAPVERPRVAA